MDPRDFKSLLRQTVALPVVLVAILAGVLLWQISYLSRAYSDAHRMERIGVVSRQLIKYALDMETGSRGYLLTGDTAFLEPYNKSAPNVRPTIQNLRALVAGNSRFEAEVQAISDNFEQWDSMTRQMIQAGPKSALATDPAENLKGKQLMDSIRRTRESLLNAVDTESLSRSKRIERVTRETFMVLLVLSAIIAAVLALVIRRATHSLLQTYVRHLEAERRNAAEATEAREWLMTTLRSMREAVLTADHHGKITFMNPAAEQLTAVRMDEALAQPLSDVMNLLDEGSRGSVMSPAELISAEPLTGTAILRRRDAQNLFVEFGASPIRAGQDYAGSVVILRDISERRRSEAALRSSERLSLLGRLSATIAHEIRNPLDAVMNLVFLLRTSPSLDDAGKGLAATAEEELQRIAQITHQLLAFNREAKQPVETDVSDLISGVVKLFAPKLASAGIEVQMNMESHRRILALPGELRQVFSNLLANAIDVLPQGGVVAIRVSDGHEHGVRDREGVRVTIADNGPGIPNSVMESLFTPFFTTKGEKGTGLGLWVSRGIVTKHEGTLRLRSATSGPNRGTVFSIFLPLQPGSKALQSPAA